MGIDLIAHLEEFQGENWVHLDDLHPPRSPKLIAKILGGRDLSIHRYTRPRGFPKDASTQSQEAYGGRFDQLDGLGATWLSKVEVLIVENWWVKYMKQERFLPVSLPDNSRVIFYYSEFGDRDYEGDYQRDFGAGD